MNNSIICSVWYSAQIVMKNDFFGMNILSWILKRYHETTSSTMKSKLKISILDVSIFTFCSPDEMSHLESQTGWLIGIRMNTKSWFGIETTFIVTDLDLFLNKSQPRCYQYNRTIFHLSWPKIFGILILCWSRVSIDRNIVRFILEVCQTNCNFSF